MTSRIHDVSVGAETTITVLFKGGHVIGEGYDTTAKRPLWQFQGDDISLGRVGKPCMVYLNDPSTVQMLTDLEVFPHRMVALEVVGRSRPDLHPDLPVVVADEVRRVPRPHGEVYWMVVHPRGDERLVELAQMQDFDEPDYILADTETRFHEDDEDLARDHLLVVAERLRVRVAGEEVSCGCR